MDANQNLKHEVKFRVTSKTSGQKPWSEKWAVKMGEGEEFIVTDEILKYPSHLTSGKVICTFSMVDSKLNFEYRETEKPCLVSGNSFSGGISEHLAVTEGDGIEIGEGIKIEIVKAPELPKRNAQEHDGPSVPLSLSTPQEKNTKQNIPQTEIPLTEEIQCEPKPEALESSIRIQVPEDTHHALPEQHVEEQNLTKQSLEDEIVTEEAHSSNVEDEVEEDEQVSMVDSHQNQSQEEHREAPGVAASKSTSKFNLKKIDFNKVLTPLSQFASQISKDKATRAAGIGALALMGGVLLWKVVNNGKYAKPEKIERNIAEMSFEGDRIEIEPLQAGVSLREIDSRITQMDQLGARIGGRAAPAVRSKESSSSQSRTSVKQRQSTSGSRSSSSKRR